MADVDRQDRGRILSENNAAAVDAEPEAVASVKGLHVAFACHGIAVQPGFQLLAGVSGKAFEILGGARRQYNRLREP